MVRGNLVGYLVRGEASKLPTPMTLERAVATGAVASSTSSRFESHSYESSTRPGEICSAVSERSSGKGVIQNETRKQIARIMLLPDDDPRSVQRRDFLRPLNVPNLEIDSAAITSPLARTERHLYPRRVGQLRPAAKAKSRYSSRCRRLCKDDGRVPCAAQNYAGRIRSIGAPA